MHLEKAKRARRRLWVWFYDKTEVVRGETVAQYALNEKAHDLDVYQKLESFREVGARKP